MADSTTPSELREKIRRQEAHRDEAVKDVERAKAAQLQQAKDAGADQRTIDAITTACDEMIARIHRLHGQIVADWEKELDEEA